MATKGRKKKRARQPKTAQELTATAQRGGTAVVAGRDAHVIVNPPRATPNDVEINRIWAQTVVRVVLLGVFGGVLKTILDKLNLGLIGDTIVLALQAIIAAFLARRAAPQILPAPRSKGWNLLRRLTFRTVPRLATFLWFLSFLITLLTLSLIHGRLVVPILYEPEVAVEQFPPGGENGGSGWSVDGPRPEGERFDCGDGAKTMALYVCDGEPECPNGADEDPSICKLEGKCCEASNGCVTERYDGMEHGCDCCPPKKVCCEDTKTGCCDALHGPARRR